MEEINILFPLVPTFSQIKDTILNYKEDKISKKKNLRTDVWTAWMELSSISIFDIQFLSNDVNMFLEEIMHTFDKINDTLTTYIHNQILYIKSDKEMWVQDFYILRQKYNEIIALCKANQCTDVDREEFISFLSEFYIYILDVFQAKYFSAFK